MAKDYYKTLNLARDVDEKAIKSAYRKLAREFHPDVNPNNPGAEAKFKEISEAFQVLSDPDKRKLYDQFGEDFDKIPPGYAQYGPQNGGGSTNYGGGHPGGGFGGQGGGNLNFEELFRQAQQSQGGASGGFPGRGGNFRGGQGAGTPDMGGMFGDILGGFRGGQGRKRGPQKGADVDHPIDISFAESIRGTQRHLSLLIHGDNGREEKRDVTVKIPAGVQSGNVVKIAGKGMSSASNGPAGDLLLKVNVKSDPFWKRDGQNIRVEVPVSIAEAALGGQIPVPTLSGEVNLKIPAGTQSGMTFRLSGRGIASKSGPAGDQFVTVRVAVPKNLSAREEELIQELASFRTENPREGLPKSL